MKWIWKLFGSRKELPHRHSGLLECKFHDERQFPDLLATHYCKNCDMSICYMCSHPHFHHGCVVDCKI